MLQFTPLGYENRVMQQSLDQFYTKKEVAKLCWEVFTETLSTLNKSTNDLYFFEPSAGTGAFFDLLPTDRRLGIDLIPKCDSVKTENFFDVTEIPFAPQDTAVIGNPPFGKRGKLAIEFFNHASYFADIVAFIVPLNFRKYTVHKRLNSSMRFIEKMVLPRDSFHLDNGKLFSVNTEFQIWTRLESTHCDMREWKPLPIFHQDFQLWQYNNTTDALKFFYNEFDFAVPCQGWQDYSRKETDEKKCERNKQWILVKAENLTVLDRLMNIDYENLAQKCATAVPGFRKSDLVKEYTDMYEKTL